MATWWNSLACPSCCGTLAVKDSFYRCEPCAVDYPMINGIPHFLTGSRQQELLTHPDAASMVRSYRRPNRLLNWARRLISSEYFPGIAWRLAKERALAAHGERLVIGSGVSRYEGAVHLDIDDFPGVNLVADAHHLPFANQCIGSVICETVLEHVPDPNEVIAETFRVLQEGGHFFFIVPFIFPFHGHPNDFQRWSRAGLAASFAAFSQVEVGIHAGPCSAMVNLITEFAYLLSGQEFPKLYTPIKGSLTALLFPLKFMDKLVNHFPEAHRMAATLYVSGYK